MTTDRHPDFDTDPTTVGDLTRVEPPTALPVILADDTATALLAKAIESNVPIETMERLLALREKLHAEQARAAFFAALSTFQGECPIIPKTKVAKIGGQYEYRYAPLEVIVKHVGPILQRHGLAYTVETALEDTVLVATCTVHHVAGHSQSSTFRVPIDRGARMNDAQKAASASTYAKRYAFCNALGILTGDEDDDAHGSSAGAHGGPAKANGETKPPPPPRPRARAAETEAVPQREDQLMIQLQRSVEAQAAENASRKRSAGARVLDDTPITEPERRALYATIRRAVRDLHIIANDVNLQTAKAAVKAWCATELGVEHLEQIPQRHYLKVRGEVWKILQATRFDREPGQDDE
jgi:hypothetical protein